MHSAILTTVSRFKVVCEPVSSKAQRKVLLLLQAHNWTHVGGWQQQLLAHGEQLLQLMLWLLQLSLSCA